MANARMLAPLALLLTLTGCGCGGCGDDEPANAEQVAATNEVVEGERPEAFEDYATHTDLLGLVHLADVDRDGLFIDFGTPARMKYTVGHWKTGFTSDGTEGDVTFTRVGETGRVFFQVDEAGPLVLRFRAKPIGTQVMTVFFNNQQLEAARLAAPGSGFADYDVHVPAQHVRRGENYVLLRFGGTTQLEGEAVAVALDSLRVIRGENAPAGEYVPPTYATLVSDITLDDTRRRSIAVPRGTTLSYYVEVPRGGRLGFGVGAEGEAAANVRVTVTPEGGQAADVFTGATESDEWHDEVASLDPFEGQIVRVDLRAEGTGQGRVAWSFPSLLVPTREEARQTPAKNVVVVLIDTMRADKLRPFNPRSRVQAPVIEGLAQHGAIFELAHSPENWTKPSVASVLTSLYPATHGAKTSEARLPGEAVLLSEHLKANGFATASFIANGYVSDRFGFDQGWDHYTNFIRESKDTSAENVFGEAATWIEAHRGQRFFTYIQTIDPHVPYDPPAEFLEMYDRQEYTGQVNPRQTADLLERAKRTPPGVTFDETDRRRLAALYDGEVSYHDRELGEFIDRLKALGVYEDTLFVITSDHGEEFNDHGSWGHGHSVYEELVHVPLLFHQNGAIADATRVRDAVSTLDIVPSIVELTGVAAMPSAEGRSLVTFIRGGQAPGPAVSFSDFLDDRRAIVAGHYKLILRGHNATLFDLDHDPGEQRELERTSRPIAMRYLRIMLGQFLGASNRGRWLEPSTGPAAGALQTEDAAMDDTIRGQLRALGYAN